MRLKSVVLLAACLPVIVACSQQQAPQAASESASLATLEPIATTRQIMLGITIPTSDVVFQVGSTEPADDAAWEKVAANAAALAESGNLLLVPPRAVAQEEWTGFARSMIAAARVAQEAAVARDVDKVLDAGNEIYETCDGCHRKYMPARAGEQAPEEAPAE